MAKPKREWVAEQEFYADAQVTGRYGGEVDFGCFWSTDPLHHYGRLTWIPESGEFYISATHKTRISSGRTGVTEILLLGAIESNNRKQADRVMAGWADACMRNEGIRWIDRCLGVYTQIYNSLERVARAYAREQGYVGSGGGWIYKHAADDKPLCQGYGALGNRLMTAGHVRRYEPGVYRIVDNRTLEARQRDGFLPLSEVAL